MISFTPKEVIDNKVSITLGFDKYSRIMECIESGTDVSSDLGFQRLFNGYYRVRRNANWRKAYYDLFQRMINEKNTGCLITFERILCDLLQCTNGCVEPSFSSKMLATINPDMPIWDKNVLDNLNLKYRGYGFSTEEKVQNAKTVYETIINEYTSFLASDKWGECCKEFDCAFPQYKAITSTKKLDFYLWAKN